MPKHTFPKPQARYVSPRVSEYQVLPVDAPGPGIGLDAPFKQAVLISPLLCLLIYWVCTLQGCYDLHTSDPEEPQCLAKRALHIKRHLSTCLPLSVLNKLILNLDGLTAILTLHFKIKVALHTLNLCCSVSSIHQENNAYYVVVRTVAILPPPFVPKAQRERRRCTGMPGAVVHCRGWMIMSFQIANS